MNFFKRRNSRSAASSRTQVGDHRRSQPSLQHTNVPLPASPKLVVTAGYGLHPQISHSSLSSDDTKSSSSSRHSNGEVSPNRSAGRNLVGSEGLDTMPRQPPQLVISAISSTFYQLMTLNSGLKLLMRCLLSLLQRRLFVHLERQIQLM